MASERSERDTLRSVQLKIGDYYGYVSVLEFFSIESHLKAISSEDQTKSIELQKKRLESAEERAWAKASSACAQTPLIIVYDKGGTVEVYRKCF